MDTKPSSEKAVLVGVINRPKDLEIASCCHWYRIPVKKCPNRHIEYIAFYQTSRFGYEGKAVRYYARVDGKDIVKRKSLLPDEPDHGHRDSLYYRFSLSPLISLPQPIRNLSRRRVSLHLLRSGVF